MRFGRSDVVDRLQATMAASQSIIAAGAGIGLSAKFAERGGVDPIIIHNSGRRPPVETVLEWPRRFVVQKLG
jgi:predicted TIM-barrel enzyme